MHMPEIIRKWNHVPENFEQGKFPKENDGIHSSWHPLLKYQFDKAQWILCALQNVSLDGLQVFKTNSSKFGVDSSTYGGTSSDRSACRRCFRWKTRRAVRICRLYSFHPHQFLGPLDFSSTLQVPYPHCNVRKHVIRYRKRVGTFALPLPTSSVNLITELEFSYHGPSLPTTVS
jgi:hypothetical protein